MITGDKTLPYPINIQKLKEEKQMLEGIQLRPVKYLNNIVQQNHRLIKKRICLLLGLKFFCTPNRITSGIEATHMFKKGETLQREKVVKKSKRIHSSTDFNCIFLTIPYFLTNIRLLTV